MFLPESVHLSSTGVLPAYYFDAFLVFYSFVIETVAIVLLFTYVFFFCPVNLSLLYTFDYPFDKVLTSFIIKLVFIYMVSEEDCLQIASMDSPQAQKLSYGC